MSRSGPLVLLMLLAGCAQPDPPEQRLRELVAAAEAAAEREDHAALGDFIAEDYADSYGNDRRSVALLLRGYFLRRDQIHLVSRIETLEIAGDFAELTVLVGLVASPSDGWGLAGEVYQIDAELHERDGDWQVVAAQWRRGLGESP